MHSNNRLNKKGDLPGWAQILALTLGIMLVLFLIWLSIKSGKTGVEIITKIR